MGRKIVSLAIEMRPRHNNNADRSEVAHKPPHDCRQAAGTEVPMSLAIHSRLGPYEIQDRIGVGGMGVVYRARDTRLDRDVAVKVLPERVARDANALGRFHREVRAIAAL